MNNANQPQYDEIEKLLTQARLPEPSPELKDRVTAETAGIWKKSSGPYRGGFPLSICPPNQGGCCVGCPAYHLLRWLLRARLQADESSAAGRPNGKTEN